MLLLGIACCRREQTHSLDDLLGTTHVQPLSSYKAWPLSVTPYKPCSRPPDQRLLREQGGSADLEATESRQLHWACVRECFENGRRKVANQFEGALQLIHIHVFGLEGIQSVKVKLVAFGLAEREFVSAQEEWPS